MARCFWLICSGLFLLCCCCSTAVASESNGTLSATSSSSGNVTEREGREYNVHPPTQKTAQSLSAPSPARPKSLGTGTWKAIKIWNEPIGVSTAKQASSPQRVVAAHSSAATRRVDYHVIITTSLFICLPLFITTTTTTTHL